MYKILFTLCQYCKIKKYFIFLKYIVLYIHISNVYIIIQIIFNIKSILLAFLYRPFFNYITTYKLILIFIKFEI